VYTHSFPLDWLHEPYRDVAAMPAFQFLSLFQRWQLLCAQVEHTRGATGPRDRKALDELDYKLKAQLMRWLDQHSRARANA
jgi:hypothetical protein